MATTNWSGNLYGFTDYNGPQPYVSNAVKEINQNDEDEENPLTCGLWLEGDSLAPPCGTSITTIHALLEFVSASENDILYDMGCGDGRVCLEAIVKCNCKHVVGVEIEDDLIAKFRNLINSLQHKSLMDRVIPLPQDLREVVASLVKQERKRTESSSLETSLLPTPSIIVLYLLPEAVAELQSSLLNLLLLVPNLRIVCNTWGFSDAAILPTKTREVDEGGGATTKLFLYTKDGMVEKNEKE